MDWVKGCLGGGSSPPPPPEVAQDPDAESDEEIRAATERVLAARRRAQETARRAEEEEEHLQEMLKSRDGRRQRRRMSEQQAGAGTAASADPTSAGPVGPSYGAEGAETPSTELLTMPEVAASAVGTMVGSGDPSRVLVSVGPSQSLPPSPDPTTSSAHTNSAAEALLMMATAPDPQLYGDTTAAYPPGAAGSGSTVNQRSMSGTSGAPSSGRSVQQMP